MQLQPILSGFADAEKQAKPLPDVACKFVILSNFSAANDVINNPGNAPQGDSPNEEIYWGAGGICVNQLSPGTGTILIPAANLKQIFVRCSQTNTGKRVYFTVFDEI